MREEGKKGIVWQLFLTVRPLGWFLVHDLVAALIVIAFFIDSSFSSPFSASKICKKEVPLLHSKSLKTVKGSRSCSQTVTPQNLRLNEIGFELGTLAFFLLSFPSFSSPNQVRRKKKSSILKFTKLRDRVGEIRIHFLLSL